MTLRMEEAKRWIAIFVCWRRFSVYLFFSLFSSFIWSPSNINTVVFLLCVCVCVCVCVRLHLTFSFYTFPSLFLSLLPSNASFPSLPPSSTLQQQPPRAIREVILQLRRVDITTARLPQQTLIRNRIQQTLHALHIRRA